MSNKRILCRECKQMIKVLPSGKIAKHPRDKRNKKGAICPASGSAQAQGVSKPSAGASRTEQTIIGDLGRFNLEGQPTEEEFLKAYRSKMAQIVLVVARVMEAKHSMDRDKAIERAKTAFFEVSDKGLEECTFTSDNPEKDYAALTMMVRIAEQDI